MFPLPRTHGITFQAFKKLSGGLSKLADDSESFKSKTILGLLRAAPDLSPNIKHIENMYVKPTSDKGRADLLYGRLCGSPLIPADADELIPQTGKDQTYDDIMAEIENLEEELEKELRKLEKKVGCGGL